MTKIFSILLISFFSLFPCRKKIDKAFEALSQHDFFKAKSLFEKSVKKQPAAASYGLSKVFYDNLNHFHDLDSAKKYVDMAAVHYSILTVKEKAELLEWSIDSMSISKHNDDIASRIFQVQKDILSVDDLNAFLKTFPDFTGYEEIHDLRNDRAYKNAMADGSLFALKNFIDTYPNAKEIGKARDTYELQQFRQNTAVGTEEELAIFIRDHQESPYLLQAQNDLYKIYFDHDTKEKYEEFVSKYPENPNAEFAFYNLVELQLYNFSNESLNTFLAKYPSYGEVEYIKEYQHYFQDLKKAEDPFYVGNYEEVEQRIELKSYTEGLRTYFQGEMSGFENFRNDKLTKVIFEDALEFNSGLSVVEAEGKMGVIDRRGKAIIPLEYLEVGEYSSGLIMAYDGQDHIYFNDRGQEQMRIQEQPIGDFVNDYLIIKYRDKYGMINKKKQYILEPNFNWLEHFENREARFQLEDKYGLIASNKDTLISPIYDFISPLNNGTRLLEMGEEAFYFVNGKLSQAFDKTDRKASSYVAGYAVVKRNGKYGLIDTTFKEVLVIEQQLMSNLGKGRASIKYKNLVKFFSVDLGKVGDRIYQELRPGLQDQCIFTIRKGDGIIDSYENIIYQSEGNTISKLEGYYVIKNDHNMYGLLNVTAQHILESRYDSIEQIENSVFIIKHDGKMEVMDVSKMELIHSSPL